MKNQYFADIHDYHKWCLVLGLAKAKSTSTPPSLGYLPMLTSNDETSEGELTHYQANNGDVAIYDYLRNCLEAGNRDITYLSGLMKLIGIKLEVSLNQPYFRHVDRAIQFDTIPISLWRQPLIFIDPDIGIVPNSKNHIRQQDWSKYLLWSDLESIAKKMGNNSDLLIYQHLSQNSNHHIARLEELCDKLRIIWPEHQIQYIRKNAVAFVLITNQDASLRYFSEFVRNTGFNFVQREADRVSLMKASDADHSPTDPQKTTYEQAVNRPLSCPACNQHEFTIWPLGWDSHAGFRCSQAKGANPNERKRWYKETYRHLFRQR